MANGDAATLPNATATATPEPTTTMATPDKLNLPAPAPDNPQANPQVNTMVPAHVGRLARIGQVASALLGKQYDYQVDPKTGQTVQIPIKQKPGDVWRHIVAGTILGAAGAASEPNMGAGAELLRQSAAGVHRNREDDTTRRANAQKQFENQEKVRTEDREDKLTQAQIAHMHIQDLHADAQMDLMQQEHLDKMNDYNDKLTDATMEVGGTPARIMVNGQDINGKVDNGGAVQKQYTANPRAFDAPEGYYRIHSQKVDYTGLHYQAGKGWLNEKGEPVDMADRTTHFFYDVPKNAMNEPLKRKGSEINKIAGFQAFQDDDMHTLILGQLMGLKSQATKAEIEANKADLEKKQILLEIQKTKLEAAKIKTEIDRGNKADMVAAYEANKVLLQGAQSKLKDAASELDLEEKKQALADIDEASQNIKYIQEKLYPTTKVPAKPTSNPAQFNPQNVDRAVNAVSGLDLEQQRNFISSSKSLSDVDKAEALKRLNSQINPKNVNQIIMILPSGDRVPTTPESVGVQRAGGAKVAPESQAAYDAWWNANKKSTPKPGELDLSSLNPD